MYVNEKMRPIETITGMEGEGIKKNDGVNSTMIYYKKLCKCHNVTQYNNRKRF
jgi:hypothetical protein